MRALGASRTSVATGGVLAGNWARDPLWKNARAVPSLDLNFAGTKTLDSRVTFTRASTGTYVGSDGVLRSAVTNLLLRSEEFDNAYWTKTNSSTTQDAIAAPNGTITAEKLLTNTTSGIHAVRRDETVLASTAYTLSFYAKPGEYTFLAINHGHTLSADYHTFFDLSNGTIGTSAAGNTATIQSVGNGWYRCSVTRTTGASQTSLSSRALACQADNVTSFVGDTASGIYLWGAQLEQSATVGEYIPTTSAINSAPRFDHNPTTGESLGLLVEEARTNLLLNSATLSTQSVTVAAAANTLSFYGTGTVTLTGVSTAGPLVGTGANNRVSLTFTPTVGVLVVTVSGSVTNAQLEAGAFPTSVIPTTTATATRAADVASITGSNFSSWYNQTEGTVFIEGIVSPGLSSFPWFYNISDGTGNNSIGAYQFTNGIYGVVVASGTTATPNPAVLFTPVSGTAAKHAFAVKTSDTRTAYNATLSVAQTSTVMPVVSQLFIGQSLSSNRINNTIKRLTYWPVRLANTTLQSITTP